jgi:hypothetical protein
MQCSAYQAPRSDLQASLIPLNVQQPPQPNTPSAAGTSHRTAFIIAAFVVAVLLPLVLTFIPTQSIDTTPWYPYSQCQKCENLGFSTCLEKPLSCGGSSETERRCCWHAGSWLSTWKCAVGGDSCYQPVIGYIALGLIYLVVGVVACLCFCLFRCEARQAELMQTLPLVSNT